MSKWPCPQRLKAIVSALPSSRQRTASSIAPRTACAASGAGTMPSARANRTPASNVASCCTARASITSCRKSSQMLLAMPWYRRPPAWIGAGMKPWPSVYIFTSGVSMLVSPKS